MSPPLHPSDDNTNQIAKTFDDRATELRLGLPGDDNPTLDLLPKPTAKRAFAHAIDSWPFDADAPKAVDNKAAEAKDKAKDSKAVQNDRAKAQVVGWPPIRSYRKNTMAINPSKNKEDAADGKQGPGCLYVKVSMDGAPYLRKVDLKTYNNYKELSKELEKMFSGFTSGQCGSHAIPSKDGLSESRLIDFLSGSEYVLTYEDKDGDWMLVGDVPWEMFTDSCRKLRIMKGSDAIGLAPRAMEKCKNWN